MQAIWCLKLWNVTISGGEYLQFWSTRPLIPVMSAGCTFLTNQANVSVFLVHPVVGNVVTKQTTKQVCCLSGTVITSEMMCTFVVAQGGYDDKSRQLMLDKISFMAGIGEHDNIVKFIASCNDIDEGMPITSLSLSVSLCLSLSLSLGGSWQTIARCR